MIKNFTDLEAWKSSHSLTLEIYNITKTFPAIEKYGLTDQIRRASSSIGANIAEAWGRYHFADKNKFYYNARGSAYEVLNFIILSFDLKYLAEDQMTNLNLSTEKSIRLINGLIRSSNLQKTR